MFSQKGLSGILIILLLAAILAGYLIYSGKINLSQKQFSNTKDSDLIQEIENQIIDQELGVKYYVNDINASIRQYYAQYGKYPNEIKDLESLFNIDDLAKYDEHPFYYKNNANTYEFYAKLDTGEIYKGEEIEINKRLDANVQVEVNNIAQALNIYYAEIKHLPTDLEEMSKLQNLSFFKLMKNPFTKQNYSYLPKNNNTGFIITGQLSTGKNYTIDIPFN